MSEPVRTREEVLEDLRLGRLVRCTPKQYPEVRGWVVAQIADYASRGEHEEAIYACVELRRMDYEMDFQHPSG